ncbi:CRP/FNR family transcriptional regulator, anaerobic regulatory protein [Paenibacillaceae bacterium GAS479]|nr:CRP/FNR family transcriptional regulator, anaerobic regulatory protein [Paenibacillaceae bacterium GAS479]
MNPGSGIMTPETAPGNSFVFSADSFGKLTALMRKHIVPAGVNIFSEGEPSNYWYYLERGHVKGTKTSAEGKEFTMYGYKQGDFFGNLGFDEEPLQSFSAVTQTESIISFLPRGELEFALWRFGSLALECMDWLSQMNRLTQTKLRDLMLYGKPGALCSTLIRLANTYGVTCEDGILIEQKMTNMELADAIGAARESVNRMLADFRRAGAVSIRQGHIVIHDKQYLMQLCHCENCPKEVCRM